MLVYAFEQYLEKLTVFAQQSSVAATLVCVKSVYLGCHLLHAKQVIEFKQFQLAPKEKWFP